MSSPLIKKLNLLKMKRKSAKIYEELLAKLRDSKRGIYDPKRY